jgi:hypothetical protein
MATTTQPHAVDTTVQTTNGALRAAIADWWYGAEVAMEGDVGPETPLSPKPISTVVVATETEDETVQEISVPSSSWPPFNASPVGRPFSTSSSAVTSECFEDDYSSDDCSDSVDILSSITTPTPTPSPPPSPAPSTSSSLALNISWPTNLDDDDDAQPRSPLTCLCGLIPIWRIIEWYIPRIERPACFAWLKQDPLWPWLAGPSFALTKMPWYPMWVARMQQVEPFQMQFPRAHFQAGVNRSPSMERS